MEFLLGRSLLKNAFNLGLAEALRGAAEELGFSAADLMEAEPDAGLGSGGLGRLAACYLESMTTLEIPAAGYSICYELGIFRQKIVNGQQLELADPWLEAGEAWLVARPDEAVQVRFGGTVTGYWENGRHNIRHEGYVSVLAVPRDMMVAGFATGHTNLLRLWEARSPHPSDLSLYAAGQYLRAVEHQVMAETISKVLYPADSHPEGKALRLRQQYFLVSATVQHIVRTHKARYGTVHNFQEAHVIQINDTHPALAIPELLRILLDEEGLGWDEAWNIVTHTFAYTNHTVLPEALECWPQPLMERLLPRIWQLIREISGRYQAGLERCFPGGGHKVRELAILWGGQVRMANLCICACFAVNGVSALHTDILRREVFHAAFLCTPEKFKCVTNGVDHRRWLAQINPGLDALVRDCTGTGDYLLRPQALEALERYQNDAGVLSRLGDIKAGNKLALRDYVLRETGIALNPEAVFDVQAKRLHEYKRQLLNALHITWLYHRLHDEPNGFSVPRVFLFAAKAAPGYTAAKEIIRLICSLAAQISRDPLCRGRLQVVFLENYRVSLAERLIPAAELSEQISTAGKEASGTGNMKFMMNGALTIGTLDGSNVELHSRVGGENMFLFGLHADESKRLRQQGYRPRDVCGRVPGLREALDHISSGFGDGVRYDALLSRLLDGPDADEYLLLADFDSYRAAHARAMDAYPDKERWNRMALLNIARSGVFAADRSVREYAREIWGVPMRE